MTNISQEKYMAKRNILLLLLLILLIVSDIDCKAQNSDMSTYKLKNEVNIMKLDMNIFCLLNLLEANIPLTKQKIMDIGFELAMAGEGQNKGDYTAIPVELNDGVILDNIELREINSRYNKGTFFILNIKRKRITHRELKNNLGEFTLFALPRGDSVLEKIVYRKRIGKFDIRAAYGQEEKDVLLGISFNSIERLEQ